MLHKTKGIVLSHIKYRESSIIVRVYTEAFGLQSYVINSVRAPKSKGKMALFQPLTILDMVVYFNEQRSLHRIKEFKCHEPFSSIPYDFTKSAMALFLTEVLNCTLKLEEQNLELFQFLRHSILVFDHLEEYYGNFHLQFLLKLSKYLGFAPESGDSLYQQVHPNTVKAEFVQEEKQIIDRLLKEGYENDVRINQEIRRKTLNNILYFYRLHIDNFGELKSLQVLREIMSE